MSFTILGDRRSSLPANWSKETAVGLVGDGEIDASAGANPGAELTIVSLLGDRRVRVPTGSRVTLRGFHLVGDRRVTVHAGDGPEVTIKAYTLFGDLTVTDQAE